MLSGTLKPIITKFEKAKKTAATSPAAERGQKTLGLHRVTVREISGTRLRIGPIETIDGTPVVDIKAVLVDRVDG